MKPFRWFAGLALALMTLLAWAGGSNYGIQPGALAHVSGRVTEWPVPTPEFARDPAPGPDGDIYITVMAADRIARFDPKAGTFKEWDLPKGAHPHGLLVDPSGIVWYTGNGNGTIGRFDPATGKVTEFHAPSGGDPHTIVIDDQGILWFTVQGGQRIGRLDRATGKITEFAASGNPYGIAVDRQGYIWFCRFGGDGLGRLDPAARTITELPTGAGSKPRRMAVGPDGMLWVTAYGDGRLLKVDPQALRLVKSYPMPAGKDGGPYAVTVDGAGRVWANEINTDTVALFDPKAETFQVIPLPSKQVGIRKAVIDAGGRYWYVGSHNGRLGMIE
ncbi:MAG TPA: hypothetical protein VJ576_08645 [Rhodocyclaceae bacterium]|nr:hypothetical protein [Rhodocyclaceae bacterium]